MHRLRIIAFAAALASAGPACSGSDGGDLALDLVAHSADRAAEAATGRFEMTMEMSGPGVPEGTAVTGAGAYDNTRDAAQVTMEMRGGALGDLGGDTAFEVVAVGTVVYMHLGSFGEALGSATPWMSFDLATMDGFSDLFGGTSPLGADPSDSLAFLRGAGDAETVGREDVRGVATTHYRARVDVADALAGLPAAERGVLGPRFESLRAAGVDELPIEAWIDAAGLPRRFRMTLDLPGDTAMSVDIEFFDFGRPVSITVPPGDQVTDMGV